MIANNFKLKKFELTDPNKVILQDIQSKDQTY